MIRFLTYSNDLMSRSRMLCVETARKFGADVVYEYEPHNIDKEFYENNKAILDAKFCESGARPCDGFWLWKPYFINKVMNASNDGDIVCYVDAGCEIIADLNHIVTAMNENGEDIFLFTNGLQHVHWCKADVMKTIMHVDMVDVSYTQVQASMIFIRVNDYTRRIIKEWLLFSQLPGLIDDSPSAIPNHPEFANHRYDQAILSTIAIREKLTLHYWPDARWFSSQRYRWPNDNYPLMINHHRKRNDQWQ